MKLSELFPIFPDSMQINVIDTESLYTVSRYDGKNSIEDIYNDSVIDYIYSPYAGTLNIYIYTD